MERGGCKGVASTSSPPGPLSGMVPSVDRPSWLLGGNVGEPTRAAGTQLVTQERADADEFSLGKAFSGMDSIKSI